MVAESESRVMPASFLIVHEPSAIRFDIASIRDLVQNLIVSTEAYLHDFVELRTHPLTIVLRELLNNALAHGNQGASALRIRGSVARVDCDVWEVVVEDQGTGFNHRAVDTRLPDDPRDVRNRGLVLVAALSESVSFNAKGNRVTARVRIPGGGNGSSPVERPDRQPATGNEWENRSR